MNGEGLLKGGFLIICPTRGVVYKHEESTGSEMPYDEIGEALNALTASESTSTTCDAATTAGTGGGAPVESVFVFDKKADSAAK